MIAALPPAVREPVISSFVTALSTVFETAVPVVLLAFVLTWFLKEIKLREHHETSTEVVEPAGAI